MSTRDLSYIKVTSNGKVEGKTLVTRCGECRHIGTLIQIGQDVEIAQYHTAGLRCCPNPDCRALISVRYNIYGDVHFSPPPLIPFDTQNIPTAVLRVFREAIQCHAAGCFTASAIMIRRTLEEVCHDRGATGSNLFKRIEDLGSKIVLPQELRDALHELRLLGNDAAHIDASTFSKIDHDEIGVAIEFTKEILKATYQYSELLGRLRSLRKDAQHSS